MDLEHVGLWFAVSLGMALATLILLRCAIKTILFDLVTKEIGGAYFKILVVGLFFISVLSGVGYLSKGYTGFAEPPTTAFEWFATAYNAAASSGTAIFSYLAVIGFVSLVSHVGLVRARIISGGR